MALSYFSRTPLYLLFINLFYTFSACTPIDSIVELHNLENDSPIQTQQSGGFSVLGMAAFGDLTVRSRLEIRDLERNHPYQWNVYLLGLWRFQRVKQDDKLSYFKIAGIHGMPYEEWDGVAGDSSNFNSGYCPHKHHLFPTWHRPYLALFEEALYLNAREAIKELFANGTLKDQYNQALATFRIPYWDWAAVPPDGEGSLPASLQKPNISIVVNNESVTIPNPLYAYTFHPIPDWEYDEEWTPWPSTVRAPASRNLNASSRNDAIAGKLDGNRKNIQSRVYNLLTMEHNYLRMSNDLSGGDSLESIHGNIHNTIGGSGGGSGHMWYPKFSAFDPIFMLHHANVDRLFAIWQELNRYEWIPEHRNPTATFAIPANEITHGKTPLKPFRKDDHGNFWTSDEVGSTRIFAYTYPELIDLNENNSLINRVNALYGPESHPFTKRDLNVVGAPMFEGRRQYMVDINVPLTSLEGSLELYVFFGQTTEDTQYWVNEQSFVGQASIVDQKVQLPSLKEVPNISGNVPLTAALEAKVRTGELKNMSESVVGTYLKDNLLWNIVTESGDVVDCEEVPGIWIAVTWRKIEPAKSADEFPIPMSEFQTLSVLQRRIKN